LFEKTLDELMVAEVEIFVILRAFDDTFAQTIHSRTSYQDEDIEWNAKFKIMHSHNEQGKTVMDYSLFDKTEKAFID